MRPSSIASASLIPPLRLAIIGSGPSGFYSAARILHSLKQSSLDAPDVRVDMFERLPIPNGLVRWGVAPDHLEVKNVEHKFAEVASDPRFRFFGNVNVVEEAATKKLDVAAGSSTKSKRASAYTYPHAIEIPLSTLAQHYTHILFSYGCSHSRPLGIPGSSAGELTNVHSALDFVNWYNGHPAAHDFDFLQSEPWRKVDLIGARQMSIIGAGNVALDVARIVLRASTGSLLEATSSSKAREELAKSDIPEPILQHLSESKITQVDINARRGPAQAAFTNKELREMLALPGIGFQPIASDLLREAEKTAAIEEEESRDAAKQGTIDADQAATKAGEARVRKRLLSLLDKGSRTDPTAADKTWSLNFFRAPSAFLGAHSESGSANRLDRIQWTSTSLPKPSAPSPTSAPWGNEPTPAPSGVAITPSDSDHSVQRVSNSTFETSADLVVSSVGYRGATLSTASEDTSHQSRDGDVSRGRLTLPWDSRKGIIPNLNGRILGDAAQNVMPGLYVSGWLARGPVGVIASTMYDAYSVADLILEDWKTQTSTGAASIITGDKDLQDRLSLMPEELNSPKHGKRLTTWSDWQRVDEEELKRGKDLGKAREKILEVKEMFKVMG